MDLVSAAEFSPEGPVKKDLMKTAGSNIVIVGLETGQAIPPTRNRTLWSLSFSKGRASLPQGKQSIP
jgi:hypothetical protein